jgi:hypothetical protein
LCPSFCIIRANLRIALYDSSIDCAPQHTILPELKICAVVFGFLRLITRAENFSGLYRQFKAISANGFKSILISKLAVATMFLRLKLILNN